MWRKRSNVDNQYGDYGFVRIISEDYSKWQENAEVILVDHFPMAKDGEVKVLMTRWIVKFTEHFGDGDKEEELKELKGDYYMHYNQEAQDLHDIAYYCADGFSRWGATERIENPSEEQISEFLKKHQIEIL